ncbi:glyoxylase-like metal-dependent hydrolase (beta-lactamase superfamily II) [Chitinivorax tropicus]|uniref:Glyoxylase-like metal-dependent hydrolase (Beta-lactamase superfamily II) n=1 Tax=Chitinivorax tropicus TaxID=714531 RepID=A0A840MQF3_9PROT|nr:MBL fold metallo-hydrolase [Chitinivorax tropicus]MBB5019307.1 glyoxylase-like metal-dependent hydrolase (beta-lactamase superfamily II) [Chitinivorax tropicus]
MQNHQIYRYEHGISAIDVEYQRTGLAASHLIVEGKTAAFVDCGTNHSVPALLAALAAHQLSPDAVQYLILTHVHLDHAGGAGSLIQQLPNAQVLIHPRGARHMIDPRILTASATQVYGEAEMARSYGQLRPIPAERVVVMNDGDTVQLGSRTLTFMDTPGHARHHHCIHDTGSNGIFTGDTFGLSYRALDCGGRAFIFPTTTPPQFDPEAAHASIERLAALRPDAVYLSHFGRVMDVASLECELHECLDAFTNLALSFQAEGPSRPQTLTRKLFQWLWHRLQQQGFTGSEQQAHDWLMMDCKLNALGLDVWLNSLPK